MNRPVIANGERGLLIAVFVIYGALVAFGAFVHEPWWDEAQSWLIARDAPVPDLLSRHLAYEGHPPLWYLILAVPAKLGLPYGSMKVVAGLFGALGVFVLLFRLRAVPLLIRVITPFTFYLAYQYTVVARSYVLFAALLLMIAAIYEDRAKRVGTFTLLLALLAGVSVHGIAVAGVLAILFVFDTINGRCSLAHVTWQRRTALTIALAAWLAALLVMVWPPADLLSGSDVHSPLDPARWVTVLGWVVPQLFWGDLSGASQTTRWLATIAVTCGIATLLVWLARRRFAGGFLLMNAAVLGVSTFYYSSWHEGLFFLVLLCSVAIAFGREVRRKPLDMVVIGLLLLVLLRHVQWTVASLRYDARNQFTGSRSAALFLKNQHLEGRTVFGMGIRAFELQPYFDRNVFSNYHFSGGAFWDWSTSNAWPYPRAAAIEGRQMQDWFVRTIARRPDYVVCAIGFRQDHRYALAMQRRRDYRLAGTFQGRTFWKSSPVELIAFQVYERVRSPIQND